MEKGGGRGEGEEYGAISPKLSNYGLQRLKCGEWQNSKVCNFLQERSIGRAVFQMNCCHY